MGSSGKIARLIKAARPDARILMTGTHPAALPERTMREESVDFVCDREGPWTILKTLEALDAAAGDFSAVPSLWWRNEGRIAAPWRPEPLIRDLDAEMPGIAWDLLPMDKYRAHNWHCFDDIGNRSPYASIHTSLGCPYSCNFCCIDAPFGKSSYRMWSPEKVVGEIDYLVECHGIRHIKIVDEMFVLNRAHVLGICDLLEKRGYDLNIWAYARVDTVEEDMLERMRRAGITWLALGIESASEEVRDGASKKLRGADIVSTVRMIQAADINIIGDYIFGLPDDTHEKMQETLDLALELKCEFANLYSAMPYPGSKLYASALAEGMPLPESWHQYSQHAYDCAPLPNAHLSSAEILAFRDQAWNTCFTDPGYLAMVERKFGPAVVEHIGRMVAMPLPRKLTAA